MTEPHAAPPLASFWRGRRVLVTGHTGFKGSWLCAWLQLLGARVHGYALPPESPSHCHAAGVEGGMTSVHGDLRDAAALTAAVAAARPEVVFHLAAQPLVRRGYREPAETWEVNVMGTVRLLETLRRSPGVRAVVVVTSDKCYRNREWDRGYRESDALGGDDPYSASKAAAELAAGCWRASFFAAGGAAIATARAGNVIGGGDWAEDRIVPDLARAFAAGVPAVIRSPASLRPWQHVLDPLHGYLRLAMRLCDEPAAAARAWNFGPAADDAVPVLELACGFARAFERPALLRVEVPLAAPHETRTLRLDAGQARARLGWAPLLPLAEAVRWTAEWYAAWIRDPASAGEVTAAQLRAFGALADGPSAGWSAEAPHARRVPVFRVPSPAPSAAGDVARPASAGGARVEAAAAVEHR
jgi:CDP-glucose 4,6-dehydratase